MKTAGSPQGDDCEAAQGAGGGSSRLPSPCRGSVEAKSACGALDPAVVFLEGWRGCQGPSPASRPALCALLLGAWQGNEKNGDSNCTPVFSQSGVFCSFFCSALASVTKALLSVSRQSGCVKKEAPGHSSPPLPSSSFPQPGLLPKGRTCPERHRHLLSPFLVFYFPVRICFCPLFLCHLSSLKHPLLSCCKSQN